MKHQKKYILDGRIEVIFIKSFIRSLAKYLVELPGHSLALVEYYRITEIPESRAEDVSSKQAIQ